MVTGSAALLLLTDGRWPTGGHAHSGGLEPAVRSGLVTDAQTLEKWLRGRLWTTGAVDASFGALAWVLAESEDRAAWDSLVDEYWARVPVRSLREASLALGRAILRAAQATWPTGSRVTGSGWPLAFAAAARAGGADLESTTLAIATTSVQGPAWSATRLMGLDPYQVAGCLCRLAGEIEEVARRAGGCEADSPPSLSAPLLDLGAAHHSMWEMRLFAS